MYTHKVYFSENENYKLCFFLFSKNDQIDLVKQEITEKKTNLEKTDFYHSLSDKIYKSVVKKFNLDHL